MKHTLVLMRHGESLWNKENRFTGWSDVDLSEQGIKEAQEGGKLLKEAGLSFDIAYTSYLKRAIHTLNYVLDELDENYLPVIKAYQLNERHYGALQGLNKAETAAKYGEDQVKAWRRGFAILPPLLEENDVRSPRHQRMYRDVPEKDLPLGDSLAVTIERVVPYYQEHILKDLEANKNVLVAAHGNSLRALVKYLDHLSDEEIVSVNIPTAIPLVYEFDDQMHVINKYYLGDQKALAAKMQAVANQGKAN